MNIKVKLAILFSGIATIPLIFFGLLSIYNFESSINLLQSNQITIEELGESQETIKRALISLLAIVVVFNTILAYIIAKNISDPIQKLAKIAKKMANKEFQIVEVESKDEIGQLSSAFNSMATNLKELYETLEKKVEEQTNALNKELEETERLNEAMVGRELKMVELKEEIARLRAKIGG